MSFVVNYSYLQLKNLVVSNAAIVLQSYSKTIDGKFIVHVYISATRLHGHI